MNDQTAADLKACCAAAYDQDIVALVLGESYHPGGLELTRRLGAAAGLRPGQRVLDVASGPGTSALLLAAEFGVRMDGVDLAEATLQRARTAAEYAGIADRVAFHHGDGERLPFAEGQFDVVLCECAFCTFPDKPAAAREFARVLRPGGRVAISDVTLTHGELPAELSGLAGWVACLADAKSPDEYARLLGEAGLRTTLVERHDAALARMVEQIEGRLRTIRMTTTGLDIDFDEALRLTAQAKSAVAAGAVGYMLIITEKR